MIRPFDWRDFLLLHRYRKRGLWLDSDLALTRRLSMVPLGAVLAYFAPTTGLFTYVASSDGYPRLPVIGQVYHPTPSLFARFTFIAPSAAMKSFALRELLDHVAQKMGWRGARNLLAEVDEDSPAFVVLKQAGYAVYTRQRIWKLEPTPNAEAFETPWRPAVARDEIDIRVLYTSIVSALVQQAEPPPWEKLNGLVYRQDGALVAFIQLSYGPRGIWAQPFFHPEMEQVPGRLVSFLNKLSNRKSRPVYLCVRSHQAWLEPYLADLGAHDGPRQAVMVKRLTVAQKASRVLTISTKGLENAQPEASASLTPAGQDSVIAYDTTKNYG